MSHANPEIHPIYALACSGSLSFTFNPSHTETNFNLLNPYSLYEAGEASHTYVGH